MSDTPRQGLLMSLIRQAKIMENKVHAQNFSFTLGEMQHLENLLKSASKEILNIELDGP